MDNPSLTEKSIIGYEVVPTIAHDPAKCPGTKIIQTAALTDSDAPCLMLMSKLRDLIDLLIFGHRDPGGCRSTFTASYS